MDLFIKLEDSTCHSVITVDDQTPPVHEVKQGSVYSLVCKFVLGGIQQELAADTEGRLYLRPAATAGDPHVVSGSWVKAGSGASTTYTFTAHFTGTALDAALTADADGTLAYDCEVEWVDPASPTTVYKSIGHTVNVKRAVGVNTAVATLPARTARTIDVADNYTQLIALGYNAYEDLQTAVEEAAALTPTESDPVTIRLHRSTDAGITTTSLTGLRIVGAGRLATTIDAVTVTGDAQQWASFSHCTLTTLSFTAAYVIGTPCTITLAVDSAVILTINAPVKVVHVTGSATRIVELFAEGDLVGYGDIHGGEITVSGQVFVDGAFADGDPLEPASVGGDITINHWCKVSVTSVNGQSGGGTVTNNSLW